MILYMYCEPYGEEGYHHILLFSTYKKAEAYRRWKKDTHGLVAPIIVDAKEVRDDPQTTARSSPQ